VILTIAMAHPRKLIRQAVVALLVDADTAAGARVQGTRVEPHKKSQLPAISVYTLREPVDQDASVETAPRELTRNVKVEITGWVAHTDDVPVDDAMDDLAEEIEAAMDADPYLDSEAADSILEETVMQVVEDDGHSDPLIGVVTLTYSVTYRTSPAAPADLDDFLSVEATHAIVGGVEDTVPAEDQFTVQETP
jgi:hypothetical protein